MITSATSDTRDAIPNTQYPIPTIQYPTRNTQHASRTTFDIYFVGVGGQGVLTLGEIIAEAALRKGMPVNFYPTKGMAQRGGFVKAQLRLGRAAVGPMIPERAADLVVATEVSEALKAVRFVKPDGDFVLYAHVWAPTAVMLGKAPYPKLEQVAEAARAALYEGGRLHVIPPESLPVYEGAPVPDNIFTLAVMLNRTRLGDLLPPAEAEEVVRTRWKRGVEANMAAFQAGLAFGAELDSSLQADCAVWASDRLKPRFQEMNQ